jgi:nucleoside-diphosphate-sugar epimerase
MNVLVLGGGGLFGRKTVIQMARDPEIALVVSMDVVPTKDWVLKSIGPQMDKVRFVQGDVSQLEDILQAIRRFAIDRLVNWAFILPGETLQTNPRLGVKVNELGMCNSFEAARLMGINRVVYASSEGVYGPQDEYGNRPVTEADPMHPGSAYAIAKQLSEILAAQYSSLYGMSLTAVRPCIGYGHGGLTPLMIKHFCDIVSLPAVGKPFAVPADGTATVSLSAADDVAALARILIKLPSSPHPAYNVGGAPTPARSGREDRVRQGGPLTRPRQVGDPLDHQQRTGPQRPRVFRVAPRSGSAHPRQRCPHRGRPAVAQGLAAKRGYSRTPASGNRAVLRRR